MVLYMDDFIDGARFEWDEAKNRLNQAKHGVSFEEARHAFADANRVILTDLDHGAGEARFFCLGLTGCGVMTVRFTYRKPHIRIFGAGYWRKGRRIYENGRYSIH
jgi:uncharacterized DUF497 family protein